MQRSLWLPLYVWAGVYDKTILRPGGELGRARTWKGGRFTQMWTESSTLRDCLASQGVTDPGSKLRPVTQVNQSHRSLLNSLGDPGPAQAEHGITKSKGTREGEPRKRQLRESKPPNRYSQTCTSQQREPHKSHTFSKTELAESTPNFIVPAAARSRQWPSPAKSEPACSPLFSVGNKADLGKTTQRRDDGEDKVHSMGKNTKNRSWWRGAWPREVT